MKTLTILALTLAAGIGSSAAAATSASAPFGARSPNALAFTQDARWKVKLPKIHKCKPIKNGISCEIKLSELSAREQAERAAAVAMARAKAQKDRNDAILRADENRRRQEIENNRRIEEAKRRGKTA